MVGYSFSRKEPRLSYNLNVMVLVKVPSNFSIFGLLRPRD